MAGRCHERRIAPVAEAEHRHRRFRPRRLLGFFARSGEFEFALELFSGEGGAEVAAAAWPGDRSPTSSRRRTCNGYERSCRRRGAGADRLRGFGAALVASDVDLTGACGGLAAISRHASSIRSPRPLDAARSADRRRGLTHVLEDNFQGARRWPLRPAPVARRRPVADGDRSHRARARTVPGRALQPGGVKAGGSSSSPGSWG